MRAISPALKPAVERLIAERLIKAGKEDLRRKLLFCETKKEAIAAMQKFFDCSADVASEIYYDWDIDKD